MTPERLQKLNAVIARRQPDITVVLENVHNPNNVSAVMRTCDAVGIQEIYVINNRLPPVKNWGRRSNAGTASWLDVHQYSDVASLIKDLKKKYKLIFASAVSASSQNLYSTDLTESIAFVFGNEREGLSADLFSAADALFTIPQVGMNPSLNISVACAVTLYETFRQKEIAGHYQNPRLDPKDASILKEKWKLA